MKYNQVSQIYKFCLITPTLRSIWNIHIFEREREGRQKETKTNLVLNNNKIKRDYDN